MITEEQRRALFALREALRLCEGANVVLKFNEESCMLGTSPNSWYELFPLCSAEVSAVLRVEPFKS